MPLLFDAHRRPLRSLRLSVTDRCNLRCAYCMPEEEYRWLERAALLSFEELARLVDRFLALGVTKVRLTGGEPLLRRDLDVLVAALATKPGLADLALTTNGLLLAEQAAALKRAGLHRLTVSIDTLDPRRFEQLTRRSGHDALLAGIEAARRAGFRDLKLDTVVLRGVNDDEVVPLLRYAQGIGAEIRFIEYMDVGGATRWSRAQVVPRAELLATVAAAFGPATPLPDRDGAPAERFALRDGTTFGIIASTTAPFCASCDRSRLTADGMWFTCLYATQGLDLRGPLRAGASDAELEALLAPRWQARSDRGAEERLALHERAPFAPLATLQGDPHLEMHTRGG
ncbi:MAG: GTP 3',8-cyclase MoaA [Planctomycetes bacterium]|nr:GTP 3',8-cyclase MoaA [Planctomycetota bacterium]